MKKKLLLVFVSILILLSTPIYTLAISRDVYFNNDDGEFSVYSNVSIKDNKQEVFGVPPEKFEEYMRVNDMLLYGTDNKNIVFNVSCAETDFSKDIVDFANYSDESVLEIADTLVIKNEGVFSINGTKYFVINSMAENDADFSEQRQYVTVKNGTLYVVTLNFIYGIEGIDDLSRNVIERVIFNSAENVEFNYVFVVIVLLLILLVAFVVVCLIVSIFKDLRKQ